jgi:hypothetical protein
MTAAALGRHYALRVTGLYLLGAWAVWLLVTIPGIAWTVTSLLV